MEIVKLMEGRITIPVHIRARLRVGAGDDILLLEENGRIILMRAPENREPDRWDEDKEELREA